MSKLGTISALRRHSIRRLRRMLIPKLRGSGWETGPLNKSKTLLICAFPEGAKGRDVSGFKELSRIYGFTAEGVISDAHIAAVITLFDDLCAEDLIKLEGYVRAVKDELS